MKYCQPDAARMPLSNRPTRSKLEIVTPENFYFVKYDLVFSEPIIYDAYSMTPVSST